ncbi:MAG: Na/Pi cotransporter family protein [Rhodobacteraceae bacterium]|nr:Na/Pi cotransporter family protein [Paracoccaceae bacterium]
MAIISFIIHLMSGATLLLFAVRFLRIGVERLWSGQIRESLSQQSTKRSLLAKGAFFGFVMQGATVVMLMAAGLVGSNTISILSATLVAMGADLGSALAVQFLTLPVSALGPAAILVGGWLYLNSEHANRANFGRVLLGIGLVFLALVLIRQAVEPLKEFPGTQAVIEYLNADPVTAAICGLVLTFLMHSSLAAVLTALAFASHGNLGPIAGIGFVIGCNIGSALLPVWLLRNEDGEGQVVAKSLALMRSLLAIVLLLIVATVGQRIVGALAWSSVSLMMAAHLAFNTLLLFFAPLAHLANKPFVGPYAVPGAASRLILNDGEGDPDLVILTLRSHVNRMLDQLVEMFDAASAELPDSEAVAVNESRINSALSELRTSFSSLPELSEAQSEDLKNIFDFAIRLENCGDVLSGRYQNLRLEATRNEFRYSPEGSDEIDEIIEALRKGFALAQSVFWTGDEDNARRLVLHKQHVAQLEEKSRVNHLQRVRAGNLTSLSSSNQHLEAIAALKSVNSKLATIAYAVLEQHGALKKTRLKNVAAR